MSVIIKAIKKINSNAVVTVYGSDIDTCTIKYHDGTPEISKSEIRRLIKSNGIKLNNETVLDEKYIIDPNLFSDKGFIKLSIGKKKHFKITN